jgi:hypothetical protein
LALPHHAAIAIHATAWPALLREVIGSKATAKAALIGATAGQATAHHAWSGHSTTAHHSRATDARSATTTKHLPARAEVARTIHWPLLIEPAHAALRRSIVATFLLLIELSIAPIGLRSAGLAAIGLPLIHLIEPPLK